MRQLLSTLQAQHASLRPLVALVEAQGRRIALRAAVDIALLAEIMDFISEYPRAFHHPVEARLLDVLARRGRGTQRLMAEFAAVDRRLEIIGEEFAGLLEAARRGEAIRLASIGSHARIWAAAQRERLDMEDELLFPLADQYLTRTDWARLERDDRLEGKTDLSRFEQRRLAIAKQAGCAGEALAA